MIDALIEYFKNKFPSFTCIVITDNVKETQVIDEYRVIYHAKPEEEDLLRYSGAVNLDCEIVILDNIDPEKVIFENEKFSLVVQDFIDIMMISRNIYVIKIKHYEWEIE